jgi:hypothetical protein
VVEDIDKAAYISSRYAQEEYSLNLSGFFNEENLRIEKWANSGRGDQGNGLLGIFAELLYDTRDKAKRQEST